MLADPGVPLASVNVTLTLMPFASGWDTMSSVVERGVEAAL
jgi:hypothetical protein